MIRGSFAQILGQQLMPNEPRPRRRSLRLPGYEYSHPARILSAPARKIARCSFREIIDGDVPLNELGTIRATDMG